MPLCPAALTTIVLRSAPGAGAGASVAAIGWDDATREGTGTGAGTGTRIPALTILRCGGRIRRTTPGASCSRRGPAETTGAGATGTGAAVASAGAAIGAGATGWAG